MQELPFRQIHLDFHTSPAVPGIGSHFDRDAWQRTLQAARVDSVTLFAKCHHGWSYHPTEVGRQHPELHFDLLRAQYDACRAIGVRTPIYISAGFDNLAGWEHPEWRETSHEGHVGPVTTAGWFSMCFHTPYLDYLCEQIEEVVRLFPDCDGIFLDIIKQTHSCSAWGLAIMRGHGLDPREEEDRRQANEIALQRYYERTSEAAKRGNPDRPVFHNSGHIQRGDRTALRYQDHLEIESLPTGGWGYDHFPLSAKYAQALGAHDYLGMTGRFHTTWGEFGGYKHPNALRYECATMLAHGGKCSVGDQLPPHGALDSTTYRLVGEAYEEVAAKEPWCRGVAPLADLGLLSAEACGPADGLDKNRDQGAVRALLEGHFLFDVLDAEMDFSRYKALVLPDAIRVDETLQRKLQAYLADGGRLVLTGRSGFRADADTPALDLGGTHEGPSPFEHDFILPTEDLRPDAVDSPMVMYAGAERVRATTAQSLGAVYDPYFNRNMWHFCSHQHAPARPEPNGYDAGLQGPQLLYLPHPVFGMYADFGAVPQQQWIVRAITRFLHDQLTIGLENFPSTARVSMMHQPAEKRYVLHMLYANTIARGGGHGRPQPVEVVQELMPLRDVGVSIRIPASIREVTRVPAGASLPFEEREGALQFRLDEFTCHEMLALSYAS